MNKLLTFGVWTNGILTILSFVLGIAAVLSKGLQESLPFLVFISIFAITATHFVGFIESLAHKAELKEIKKAE